MGYDTARFPGKVDEELICPICACVLEDPLEIPACQHSFCRSCILKWFSERMSCPVDRFAATSACLRSVPRIVKNLLSRLNINCENVSYGCSAKLNLDNLAQHLVECDYKPKKPVPCKLGCDLVILREEMKNHNCARELKALMRKQQLELSDVKRKLAEQKSQLKETTHLLSFLEANSYPQYLNQTLGAFSIHHVQHHYQVQLLSHLLSLSAAPQTNQTQLHCLENAALRLITGFELSELQPQAKMPVSAESEELNRVLVLTLARSMHVTGTESDPVSETWCKELLTMIMQNTPLSWADSTLNSFPQPLKEFFQENTVPKKNMNQLNISVEEEYQNWLVKNNEAYMTARFFNDSSLFLCLLWKLIYEKGDIPSYTHKVLERIGARALLAHLRNFCDYLEFNIDQPMNEQQLDKFVGVLKDMIWKYNIVSIDRLVLFMILRTKGNDGFKGSFAILRLLLLREEELTSRISYFVKENSPHQWKKSNWHEKHLGFYQKYPEGETASPYSLPVYFSNVCLRFLPVLDIVIHRLIELPPLTPNLKAVLQQLGCLYKFHDRPITYLYNTLHYYDRLLRRQPMTRRRLASVIIGASKEIRPRGWSLSPWYLNYLAASGENASWVPHLGYYFSLIRRIVENETRFPTTDWRFHEFSNPADHALYVTCAELMALPVPPDLVTNNLLDIVMMGYGVVEVGLVLAALPESYWSAVGDRLIQTITCDQLATWSHSHSATLMFIVSETQDSLPECKFLQMLALVHAIWRRARTSLLPKISKYLIEKVKAEIKTEDQLVYLYHLVGPLFQRLNAERPECVRYLISELFKLLEKVEKLVLQFNYMDTICKWLNHVTFMYVGDLTTNEIEGIVLTLKPELQMRLKLTPSCKRRRTE